MNRILLLLASSALATPAWAQEEPPVEEQRDDVAADPHSPVAMVLEDGDGEG